MSGLTEIKEYPCQATERVEMMGATNMTFSAHRTAMEKLRACAQVTPVATAGDRAISLRGASLASDTDLDLDLHFTQPRSAESGQAPDRMMRRRLMGLAQGTLVTTQSGPIAIEDLRVGDMISTFDSEIQPIRWILRITLRADDTSQIVRLASGSYGHADLLVAPDAMILVEGAGPEAVVGTDEVLVSARNLVDESTVHSAVGTRSMTFYQLLFDKHELVTANGRQVASLYPDSQTLDSLDACARDALFKAIPSLRTDADSYGVPARMRLSKIQADKLKQLR